MKNFELKEYIGDGRCQHGSLDCPDDGGAFCSEVCERDYQEMCTTSEIIDPDNLLNSDGNTLYRLPTPLSIETKWQIPGGQVVLTEQNHTECHLIYVWAEEWNGYDEWEPLEKSSTKHETLEEAEARVLELLNGGWQDYESNYK